MNIIGINAYHGDASAALVVDGQLVAAVEEERFNRVKHWAGFPAQSIGYCLNVGNVQPRDVDHIAVSFDPSANVGRKALFALKRRPSLKTIFNRLKRQAKSVSIREQFAAACDVDPASIRARVHNVEHHDAHIASGFLLSPFERAAVMSIDGMGDFVSTVLASGNGCTYKKHAVVHYPHSLGFLYNAVTLFLGFRNYGDEYKVMGLAPYGTPRFLAEFRDIIRLDRDGLSLNLDYFTHQDEGISMSWEAGAPHIDPFYSRRLVEVLGPARRLEESLDERHNDIAASLQRVTEEVLFGLLRRLHDLDPSRNVVLVGGVAMNSVANGKVNLETPFERVFVPVGAADNGTSYGAAFHVWHQFLQGPRQFELTHAYWGPEYDRKACLDAVRNVNVKATVLEEDPLLCRVVDALCEGKVVGWFRGRMEFGARALGNRSLLADPRRGDMRDIINLKIKFREKFRPFAPSILEEHVAEYFEQAEPSPFMEKVFQIREKKRTTIPAVTHVDGSGRLQTVSKQTNLVYHQLISRFRDRTGVPLLLNTSLNENEPIVNTPAEALSCFLRTQMDYLVLGDVFVERNV